MASQFRPFGGGSPFFREPAEDAPGIHRDRRIAGKTDLETGGEPVPDPGDFILAYRSLKGLEMSDGPLEASPVILHGKGFCPGNDRND